MDEPNSNYLTAEGIQKLSEELDYLINVRRPEVARQIADAKADGDVSENAGYDEAKNTQAFVEGRILTLRNILGNAVVINSNGHKDIVGSTEVDPGAGRISLKSPIGRALMGHRVGESVEVQTPGGGAQFEIVKAEPCPIPN